MSVRNAPDSRRQVTTGSAETSEAMPQSRGRRSLRKRPPPLRSELLLLLPDLRAFARFLVRDRVAADDLVQDTVVRALAGPRTVSRRAPI